MESLSEEEEFESSDNELGTNRKAKKKKGKGEKLNRKVKEPKGEERVPEKPDLAVQLNIKDLAERFRCLELKLVEQSPNRENQPRLRSMYCIMCGQPGHGIRDCYDSKALIGQGVCRMDLNGRVVMSDGSSLPHAEGDGGAARMIRLRLNIGNPPMVPTSTSASNVEVNPVEPYHNEEPKELAILGAMEFEVIPAEQTDKSKRTKPYDRPELKKIVEKTLPKAAPQLGEPVPNRAYVELPPTILKHPTPEPSMRLVVEEKKMEDVIPSQSKGKQKETPAVVPTTSQVPEVMPNKLKANRVLPPKKAPQFKVIDPKLINEKSRNQSPQYKYVTEMMNEMNPEEVFRKLLDQPVTMKLGEILGSSYELRK